MMKFMKDYLELFKETYRFYRNHWFGIIVLNLILITIECVYLECKYEMFGVKEFIQKKFKKEDESEN